jgi:hypothetical protein
MSTISRLVAPLACGLVLVVAPARAADHYVAPTGSGSACTQVQPCREIRDALALFPTGLGPGDTIFVADGSYLGFDVEDIHGAPGQPITILAQGPGAVVTVTDDRPDNRDTIFITFSSFITVDGLTAFGAIRSGVRVDESPNVTIRNGVFGNNTTWGIFTDFSDNLLLENNECFGSIGQHGIYVSNSGDNPVVRGNRLHHNHDAGVQLNADASQGGDGIITGALIEDNYIYENGTGGAAGINLDGVQDSLVQNNLLYENHATGIVNYMGDGAEGPKGMQIYNNTVVQAADGRWALQFGITAGPNTVRNNILYHPDPNKGGLLYLDPADVPNVDSDYNILDRISPDDEGTLFTLAEWQQSQARELNSRVAGPLSALFVDSANADYHLPQGSPAVDHGATLEDLGDDIEGTPRPQGPAYDVGAYERPAAAPPVASIADLAAAEGNAGVTVFSFSVTLSSPAASTVSVFYQTMDGTATSPSDYQETSGTLSFAPGATSAAAVVNVVGDAVPESDETFTVIIGSPVGVSIGDGEATGVIVNDDIAPGVFSELVHGSSRTTDLGAVAGVADVDLYRIGQRPRSSYEVVVDATTGDLGTPASPIVLERLAADLATLLQTSAPLGTGQSRVLGWENPLPVPADTQVIRVRSGGCTTACDAADTYRIRAYETTGTISRFNNSGTQITVLVLQNGADTPVAGDVWYWNTSGGLAGSQFFSLAPRATLVVNTAATAPATGGAITISHDGRYGQLSGKAVAVEPATGFTFDTPMTTRPR